MPETLKTWPSSLPQYVQQDSYSETIIDPVLRTAMDAGPVKTRLRFTMVPEQFNVSIPLTAAQRLVFLAFYKSDLNYGVDTFSWYHPANKIDGAFIYAVCRFTSVYSISANGNEFIASFSMEVVG